MKDLEAQHLAEAVRWWGEGLAEQDTESACDGLKEARTALEAAMCLLQRQSQPGLEKLSGREH